ncbi:MAG TPA: hypothetical protein VGG70_00955 [Candidatus Cybelea sp.]|jgi:hypothetical protein
MLTLVAAVTLQAYAATPQGAALRAMYTDPKSPPIVKRVNVVGAYATVLTTGGRIEGELVTEAILVERFSFGWQALDALNLQCRLDSHRLSQSLNGALMRGMPRPQDDRPCRGLLRDAGPHDDVETVRRLMRGPLVPYVVVSGNWAMGEWYGAGGGEALYQKHEGRWHLVEDGGGAMGVDYMRKFGVPQSDWCRFGIFDAKCP